MLPSNELMLGSRLDYANSILYGVLAANIHKLQRMQTPSPVLLVESLTTRAVKLSTSNTGDGVFYTPSIEGSLSSGVLYEGLKAIEVESPSASAICPTK